MQIHLSPRNVRLTGAIHAYIAEKIIRLEDIPSEILAAQVVLMHEENTAAGVDVRPGDCEVDLHTDAAIDKISDKLARQLRKRKTRLVDKQRKSSLKEGRR